jgi:hypothetical protein
LVLALFLAAAWLAPLAPEARLALQSLLGIAALVVIMRSAVHDRVPLSELGLRVDNVVGSTAFFLAVTLLPLSAVWWLTGAHRFRSRDVLAYVAWALFQQFVVVAGVWRHFRPQTGRPSTWRSDVGPAALAAGLFAAAHAPNLKLIAIVFGAELVWLIGFTRFRNLFALALAHAVAAVVVKNSLLPGWLHSMKVGLGYWTTGGVSLHDAILPALAFTLLFVPYVVWGFTKPRGPRSLAWTAALLVPYLLYALGTSTFGSMAWRTGSRSRAATSSSRSGTSCCSRSSRFRSVRPSAF